MYNLEELDVAKTKVLKYVLYKKEQNTKFVKNLLM